MCLLQRKQNQKRNVQLARGTEPLYLTPQSQKAAATATAAAAAAAAVAIVAKAMGEAVSFSCWRLDCVEDSSVGESPIATMFEIGGSQAAGNFSLFMHRPRTPATTDCQQEQLQRAGLPGACVCGQVSACA